MTHIICSVTNDLTYDQRMQRIGCSLVTAGFEVTLVGRRKSSSKPLPSFPFQTHRLPCFFEKGKLFYVEYNLRLLLYLFRQKHQIGYAVDLDSILPQLLISRYRKIVSVYDAHEYFTETPEVVRRPFVQHVWAIIAKFAIPRVTHCITVGEKLAEILGSRYGKPFAVVRNMPIREQLEQSSPSKPPFRILYQGMLNEGRGLEVMIAAMRLLENVELWLVGEGDLSEQLRLDVAERNLGNKVKFFGFVAPEKLKNLTSQAHIGINLLEDKGLSYYYSLANKTFDYVQAHLPSIQMNFPEYRALNEEYECFLLIDDLDIKNLQLAVRQLVNNELRYQKLKHNCQQAAEKWHWETEAKTLLEILCYLK